MKLIRGLQNHHLLPSACVATVGNFDGFHLGHQALLREVIQLAKEKQVPSLVMVFEPQPGEFFSRGNVPARLQRFSEKYRALHDFNIDYLLCIRFNHHFSELTAHEFIDQVLLEHLGIQSLFVGDDFRFGSSREGNYDLLKQAADKHGFELQKIPKIEVNGDRVSSTLVRETLKADNFDKAREFLGRPYTISGRVIRGDQLGRKLGAPTANIVVARKVSPLWGIYVVKVHGLAVNPLQAVASIGNRPTVDGTRELLEVHIFDFDEDIYGRRIEVEFVHKLRDEWRFKNMPALQDQIHADITDAKMYFNKDNVNL